jgi:hypothetical protein
MLRCKTQLRTVQHNRTERCVVQQLVCSDYRVTGWKYHLSRRLVYMWYNFWRGGSLQKDLTVLVVYTPHNLTLRHREKQTSVFRFFRSVF